MDYRINSLIISTERLKGDLEALRLDCSRDMAILLQEADDEIEVLESDIYLKIEKQLDKDL